MSLPSHPSRAFIAANPHLYGVVTPAHEAVVKPARRKLTGPALNKTEQRWQDEHPDHIPFPLALRWGKCMSYKPDFGTIQLGLRAMILIEVKGSHIYDRDIVRFKGCAAEWGWLFDFEMWQWKGQAWTRLY